MQTMSDEEELVCGEALDHDLDEGDSQDGITIYNCRNCGAEIWEEEENE